MSSAWLMDRRTDGCSGRTALCCAFQARLGVWAGRRWSKQIKVVLCLQGEWVRARIELACEAVRACVSGPHSASLFATACGQHDLGQFVTRLIEVSRTVLSPGRRSALKSKVKWLSAGAAERDVATTHRIVDAWIWRSLPTTAITTLIVSRARRNW